MSRESGSTFTWPLLAALMRGVTPSLVLALASAGHSFNIVSTLSVWPGGARGRGNLLAVSTNHIPNSTCFYCIKEVSI